MILFLPPRRAKFLHDSCKAFIMVIVMIQVFRRHYQLLRSVIIFYLISVDNINNLFSLTYT